MIRHAAACMAASMLEVLPACGAFFLCGAIGLAQQSSDSVQSFTVEVAPVITARVGIIGPPDILILHDGTNDDQQFVEQRWYVGANNRNGATVTLETKSAFRLNGGGRPIERDARLLLNVVSSDPGSGWTVTTAAAQTDYRAGGPATRVSVGARSTAPGNATLGLRVFFLTEDVATLRTGDYTVRVTGTIRAN
ncbi:MAG: hypothetical protein R3B90_16710 [Planctomycetaceae bacterium]